MSSDSLQPFRLSLVKLAFRLRSEVVVSHRGNYLEEKEITLMFDPLPWSNPEKPDEEAEASPPLLVLTHLGRSGKELQALPVQILRESGELYDEGKLDRLGQFRFRRILERGCRYRLVLDFQNWQVPEPLSPAEVENSQKLRMGLRLLEAQATLELLREGMEEDPADACERIQDILNAQGLAPEDIGTSDEELRSLRGPTSEETSEE